ncbi:hypothetical protein Vadar_024119 [Vaccinium darrowii]|uniref:Uncharacterized protein n=1 Tax=Vaccinium darrowii TaxID=229202 RepID=A0ACB7YY64_9ERIC|nr:hypothetical protein Vadar_024119 [Vaccinium darrowii]
MSCHPQWPLSRSFQSENAADGGVIQSEESCRCFSRDEILIGTNFDEALVIRIGGFGKIEVKMLSKLRHTNLVALIGYSSERQEMIFVR